MAAVADSVADVKTTNLPLSKDDVDFFTTCPVCLEDFNGSKKRPYTNCANGHSVCETCLKSLVTASQSCPICREPIPEVCPLNATLIDILRRLNPKAFEPEPVPPPPPEAALETLLPLISDVRLNGHTVVRYLKALLQFAKNGRAKEIASAPTALQGLVKLSKKWWNWENVTIPAIQTLELVFQAEPSVALPLEESASFIGTLAETWEHQQAIGFVRFSETLLQFLITVVKCSPTLAYLVAMDKTLPKSLFKLGMLEQRPIPFAIEALLAAIDASSFMKDKICKAIQYSYKPWKISYEYEDDDVDFRDFRLQALRVFEAIAGCDAMVERCSDQWGFIFGCWSEGDLEGDRELLKHATGCLESIVEHVYRRASTKDGIQWVREHSDKLMPFLLGHTRTKRNWKAAIALGKMIQNHAEMQRALVGWEGLEGLAMALDADSDLMVASAIECLDRFSPAFTKYQDAIRKDVVPKFMALLRKGVSLDTRVVLFKTLTRWARFQPIRELLCLPENLDLLKADPLQPGYTSLLQRIGAIPKPALAKPTPAKRERDAGIDADAGSDADTTSEAESASTRQRMSSD